MQGRLHELLHDILASGGQYWIVKMPAWSLEEVDSTTDGNIPQDQLVLDVDPNGMAMAVEPRALRMTPKREASEER